MKKYIYIQVLNGRKYRWSTNYPAFNTQWAIPDMRDYPPGEYAVEIEIANSDYKIIRIHTAELKGIAVWLTSRECFI